uniref:Uncharacterized protein n=1 Tax=Astyanax mexicanus TaxID=7994 RepID=A0A3B1JAG7_ASTMX
MNTTEPVSFASPLSITLFIVTVACLISRFSEVQEKLRQTQSMEAHLLQNCRETEVLLNQRKKELETINTQEVMNDVFIECFDKERNNICLSLAVQKGELDSQLSERKSRLDQFKKEEQQDQEKVQKLCSVINKHKTGQIKALSLLQSSAGLLNLSRFLF